MSFKDELNYLDTYEEKGNNLHQRVKLTETQIDDIKRENVNIPIDFLNYLAEIGAGSIVAFPVL